MIRINNVYFSAKDGFHKHNNPGVDLGDNVYGPRFFRVSYSNSDDKMRYQQALKEGKIPQKNSNTVGIGSGIAIHGTNDEDSVGHLCSRGCLHMFNKDIIELGNYITVSTPLLIYAQ